MAEYKSFHYLMHKDPEPTKAFYINGPKPLTFPELYSPRTEYSKTMISKSEKSYWRTRDRIEYTMWEDRKSRLLIVTCYNVEAKEPLRTIFLNLEVLYYEVESKARGNRDVLTKKKDKKLADDSVLWKAASDYVLARLNITAGTYNPCPVFSHMYPHHINPSLSRIIVTLESLSLLLPTYLPRQRQDPMKWPLSFGTTPTTTAAHAGTLPPAVSTDAAMTQGVISPSTTATTTTTATITTTAAAAATATTATPSGSDSASASGDPSITTNPDISTDTATTAFLSPIADVDVERMCTLGIRPSNLSNSYSPF